jgi:hypothetical protein
MIPIPKNPPQTTSVIPSATAPGALERKDERRSADGSHAVKIAKYKKMMTADMTARGCEMRSRLIDDDLLHMCHSE